MDIRAAGLRVYDAHDDAQRCGNVEPSHRTQQMLRFTAQIKTKTPLCIVSGPFLSLLV